MDDAAKCSGASCCWAGLLGWPGGLPCYWSIVESSPALQQDPGICGRHFRHWYGASSPLSIPAVAICRAAKPTIQQLASLVHTVQPQSHVTTIYSTVISSVRSMSMRTSSIASPENQFLDFHCKYCVFTKLCVYGYVLIWIYTTLFQPPASLSVFSSHCCLLE